VAKEVLDDAHVPPVVVFDSVMVAPALTNDGPVMVPADGVVFTDTTRVATAVPQLLVTL
jgi:hypothetical protein